jgi:hypothetical protein
MAIKIDLEKVYDRLEWHFIRDMLIFFKIPNYIAQVIMSCVSSSSISVLLNGGKLDSFLPSRGIRQGDPLSPYLVFLFMSGVKKSFGILSKQLGMVQLFPIYFLRMILCYLRRLIAKIVKV